MGKIRIDVDNIINISSALLVPERVRLLAQVIGLGGSNTTNKQRYG